MTTVTLATPAAPATPTAIQTRSITTTLLYCAGRYFPATAVNAEGPDSFTVTLPDTGQQYRVRVTPVPRPSVADPLCEQGR